MPAVQSWTVDWRVEASAVKFGLQQSCTLQVWPFWCLESGTCNGNGCSSTLKHTTAKALIHTHAHTHASDTNLYAIQMYSSCFIHFHFYFSFPYCFLVVLVCCCCFKFKQQAKKKKEVKETFASLCLCVSQFTAIYFLCCSFCLANMMKPFICFLDEFLYFLLLQQNEIHTWRAKYIKQQL